MLEMFAQKVSHIYRSSREVYVNSNFLHRGFVFKMNQLVKMLKTEDPGQHSLHHSNPVSPTQENTDQMRRMVNNMFP